MFDESNPPSPTSASASIAPMEPEWQPILHASNQVVLYNPTSHALSIQRQSTPPHAHVVRARNIGRCPYCNRSLPAEVDSDEEDHVLDDFDDNLRSRAANYFQLLQNANESASVSPTPRSQSPPIEDYNTPSSRIGGASSSNGNAFRAQDMAEGYFKAFFQEEARLGMGANGSVYLCQHVLDGNPLGHFAVKKIAVGQSHSYLVNILREVRLLERLHHPNIITYHHAWLENCQFSSFGPKVPTLHLLMQWAEGGSLDDFIDARLGRPSHLPHLHPVTSHTSPIDSTSEPTPSSSGDTTPTSTPYSRGARIRAFRAFQQATPEERERMRQEAVHNPPAERSRGAAGASGKGYWKAVHLLSAEEVKSLFSDVAEGLAFLHDRSILHLDLKPGNVLLTWDEGKLIPRAMLSDFGTSQDMLGSRTRTGNTGTLEYTSPESLPSPSTGLLLQIDSKSDMWSLGMILHKLLFFRLPYRYAADNLDKNAKADSKRDGKQIADLLEREVANYPGFKAPAGLASAFESRRIPRAYILLLETLLNVTPSARPSCERVVGAIREGRLDPITPDQIRPSKHSLIPALRRPTNADVPADVPLPVHTEHETRSTGVTDILDGGPPEEEVPLPSDKEEEDPAGRFLPLPAPALPDTPLSGANVPPEGAGSVSWQVSRVIWMRTVKSCILVAKVWSLSALCPDALIHPVALTLLMTLAIMDTWFDGLRVSAILGLVHIALVRFACRSGRCCT